MTDEEIIKDLTKLSLYTGLQEKYIQALNDALDLINRQKTEIERLKCEMGKLLPKDCSYAMQMEVSNKLESQIKSEAIKEFAERLKEKISDCHIVSDGEYCGFDCSDIHECINNLLQEMVGEDNA